MFRFERLHVWRKALEVYDLADQIADRLPEKYRFSIADQLRRAALSVSSNIAEGSGRETVKECGHFFTIAKSSAFEVVSIVTICQRRGLITPDASQEIYRVSEEICKMLSALRRPKEKP